MMTTIKQIPTTHGNIDIIKKFIEDGNDPNDKYVCGNNGYIRTLLCDAVIRGYAHFVKYLLDIGANPNIADDGHAPLHIAASQGHICIVKMLVEAGADIHMLTPKTYRDHGECTPLHFAAKCNNIDTVKYLLNQGVDKTILNMENKTAYDIAMHYSHNIDFDDDHTHYDIAEYIKEYEHEMTKGVHDD